MLPPQVGIQREGEVEYRFYTEEELRRNGPDILPAETKAKFRLLAANDDEAGLERVKGLVRSLVPKFRVEGDLDMPPPERIDNQIIVEVRGLIDTVIARMVAKIGFNYMAKQAGTHFAIKRCFDPMRRFIRYGEGGDDWRAFVRILSEPLLAEETRELRVTQGHVVLLDWRGDRTLQARVGPYNSLAYEVTLTASYDGVWMPLKIGHVFDWEHGVVHKLQTASGLVLLPGVAQRAAKAYAAIAGRRNRR